MLLDVHLCPGDHNLRPRVPREADQVPAGPPGRQVQVPLPVPGLLGEVADLRVHDQVQGQEGRGGQGRPRTAELGLHSVLQALKRIQKMYSTITKLTSADLSVGHYDRVQVKPGPSDTGVFTSSHPPDYVGELLRGAGGHTGAPQQGTCRHLH